MNSGHKFARPLLVMTLWVGAAFLLNASQAVAAPVADAPYTLATFKGTAPSGADGARRYRRIS